ncbi:MAG: Bax inhibitor-1/YccA family protein [Desulfomonile tiedjei]|uniref:Bax inhibitor-1/YccA family protein n=1 Tax=Desulfomonile tiedjei TaxID=2358 RepID=A0A9D6V443_9BACT|nr:Bax inhibitor-1/YccA family protein [Desulfomonile tiedjei]
MRTSNPALNDRFLSGLGGYVSSDESMTVQGTVNKAAILILCALVTSGWLWIKFFQSPNPATVTPWMIGGAIGGLVVALVTVFKMSWAPVTAPLYSLLEGLVIGGLSALAEMQFPGIVLQAVLGTFGTFLAMLAAYSSGIVKATEKFKLGVMAATGGIAVVYLISLVFNLFGASVPYIHGSGLIGIGFSLVVVTIAALNLVLDFDFIDNGVRQGAPKYMEWYAAFGLMVTLIWLYIEVLRLLIKLRSRD